MSYARWMEDSDVYVYGSEVGLVCCQCLLNQDDDFVTTDLAIMVAHLRAHTETGHKVPEYTFEKLNEEYGCQDI